MDDKIRYKDDMVYFQYDVSDIERAKTFYNEIFGLEVKFDGGAEVGWTELELPTGARLGLNLRKDGKVVPGSGTLTLQVHDLEQTKSYLESKALEVSEITDLPDMVSFMNTNDSEGNQIQIISDPRVKG